MRLFYGLSLPDAVRLETASASREAALSIPGRYVLPENHHLTLAFLGEVPPERVPDAQQALAQTIARFPAPIISVRNFDIFGRPQNAILILRAESTPALDPLNAALKEALSCANLPFDPGPFSPHITLARHADVTGGLPGQPPLPDCSFTAHTAHLFLSARDEENILRYTPIFTADFENNAI